MLDSDGRGLCGRSAIARSARAKGAFKEGGGSLCDALEHPPRRQQEPPARNRPQALASSRCLAEAWDLKSWQAI